MREITNRTGIPRLLVDETLPDPEHPLYFHYREIPPGSRAHAPHVHSTPQVEVMYVVAGEAEIQLADECYTISTGMAAEVNCSRLHGIRNAGDTPLKYMIIIADRPA